MTKRIFVLAGLILLPLLVFAQDNPRSLEQKADSLYEKNEDKSALELYHKVIEKDSDNYQALWRISFLYSRIGNRFEDEDTQKEYFNKAISWAEKALAADPHDSQSNFVMSVAMGRKALISGARDRVAASRTIKKYVDRALQADSTHAGAWHVLGRWHFKVANLSWIERTAANTLFGGIPGDASNEKAAEYIEKAISYNDSLPLYHYDLARIYAEMDKNKKAISACEEVTEMPNLTPDDEQIKKDCRKLIEDLS